MGAQHISGPWHVEDPLGDDAGDALWIVRDGATSEVYDWRCVAIVTSDNPDESDNPLPVSVSERDANAHLIAAAPDLKEAVAMAVAQMEAVRPHLGVRQAARLGCTCDHLRIMLAKAEGRS